MDKGLEEERFSRAADRMRANTALKLTEKQRLELYGYYKQAKEGNCSISRPSYFDFTGRAKWEAWHKLGDMEKHVAMQKYVQLVSKIDPNWESTSSEGVESGGGGASSEGGGVGPSVSTLAQKEDEIPNDQKTIFDWCKEGNLDNITQWIHKRKDINVTDEEGMTPLHWACDRGDKDVIQTLVDGGADIEAQDPEGQTPLHYACFCGHGGAISVLLAKGADKNKPDNLGETPLTACDSAVKHLLEE